MAIPENLLADVNALTVENRQLRVRGWQLFNLLKELSEDHPDLAEEIEPTLWNQDESNPIRRVRDGVPSPL